LTNKFEQPLKSKFVRRFKFQRIDATAGYIAISHFILAYKGPIAATHSIVVS